MAHLRSNLVAYLALLIALGGTSYAAALPRNSVGSVQLKSGAVTTADVRDTTLRKRDFRPGQLPRGWVGVMNVVSSSTLPATGQTPVQSYTFTTPAAGTVAIEIFFSSTAVTCTPANASVGGFYLDGTPLQDSAYLVSSGGAVVLRAVATASKGEHTVVFGIACLSGSVASYSFGNPSWRAELVAG